MPNPSRKYPSVFSASAVRGRVGERADQPGVLGKLDELRAVAVDTSRQHVRVETDEGLLTVRYEELVIALGAVSRTLPIPGLAEHALGFKTLADAIHLRNHVLQLRGIDSTQEFIHRQEQHFGRG